VNGKQSAQCSSILIHCRAGLSSITFGLFGTQDKQIALIWYTIPSIVKVVLDGPPHQGQYPMSSAKGLGQKGDNNDDKCPQSVEGLRKENVRKTESPNQLAERYNTKGSL
jgi:hypothetical protein